MDANAMPVALAYAAEQLLKMEKVVNEVPFDEVRVVQNARGEQALELLHAGTALARWPIPTLDVHSHFSVSGLKGAIGFTLLPA